MTPFDKEIWARTVFAEASSEGREGMRAVAHVIANRVKRGTFGDTPAVVCLNGPAFSCWNAFLTVRGKTIPNPDRIRMTAALDTDPELNLARLLVDQVIAGDADPTNGATHYYSQILATPPAWSVGHKPCYEAGRHVFFNDIP